jgi:hypothetical protein
VIWVCTLRIITWNRRGFGLAQGNKEKAREHLATAKEMIERMGYYRRDKAVNELEQQLG